MAWYQKFTNNINKYFSLPSSISEVATTNRERGEAKYGRVTEWFFAPILGQPRGVDTNQLRYFCKSVWAKTAINTIVDEVVSLDWEIVPINPEDEFSYNKIDIDRIKLFFDNPNRNHESIKYILRAFIKDILEVDAGAIVKVFNSGSYEDEKYVEVKDQVGDPKQPSKSVKIKKTFLKQDFEKDKYRLTEIYARDGASFLKDVNRFGIEYGYYQYSHMQPSYAPIWFDKNEVIYVSQYPRAESCYGWAPMQSVMEITESLNESVRWNRDFFKNNAVPEGAIELVGADETSIKNLKAEWEKEFKERPHRLLFHATKGLDKPGINFVPFQKTAKEMEFMSSQKWYATIVCMMFKTTPAELGIVPENRATQEGQERVHLRRAVKPIIDLIEYHFNTELMVEFFTPEEQIKLGKTGGLKWQFKYIDPIDEAKQKELEYRDLEHGVVTINEIRRKRGLEEVEWGNEPYKKFGGNEQFGIAAETNELLNQRKPKDFEPSKSLIKTASISTTTGGSGTAGTALIPTHLSGQRPDKIDEKDAKSYSDYLEKEFNKLRRKSLKAVEELDDVIEKSEEENVKKTFGEFITKLFNAIFSVQFWDNVRKYIKQDYKEGIKNSEKELKFDIGFEEQDEQTVDFLTDQQINGYTMSDGKKFVGIKGAKHQLQIDIINSIHEGITKRENMNQLKERVIERFDVNESRAMKIARTETNRIVNKGKVEGYKKSGLSGKKKWISFIDENTSEICRHLNNKEIDLTGAFEYEEKIFENPPAHPNCRSTIVFLPD